MNGIQKTRLSAALLLAALTFTGCSKPQEMPPLAGAAIGGPFQLTDQDGKAVTDRDFTGQYRIVYFGYSFCPDVCPVDLQHIAQGYAKFEKTDPSKAKKVRPIFISVDPERDTPAVLKQYVAAFHPRLVGLTGTPDQLKAVAKAYGVYYQRRDVEGASEYLMDHSRSAVLFGPDGSPIALIPQDQGADAVAAELQRWVI
nr:SCO family protein [Allosphingosinicella vermicomposti]